MKQTALMLMLMAFSIHAQAAIKPCEELKDEIAQKIESKGVESYTLRILPVDQSGDGREVGTCEGGSKKILYIRGSDESEVGSGE